MRADEVADRVRPDPVGQPAPRMLLSCVGENRPDWFVKIHNLVLSVRLLGEAMTDLRIVVHFVGAAAPDFVSILSELGAEVRVVEPVDRRVPSSNKLRMLELASSEDFEVLLMLDCDVIVVGDLSAEADPPRLRALPAIRNPTPDATWRRIYQALGLPLPERECLSISGEQGYPYFNGGVLFVPHAGCGPLLEHWNWARDAILELEAAEPGFLGGKEQRDQTSLPCALVRAGLCVDRLPVNLNFRPHSLRVAPAYQDEWGPPFIFHYHHRITNEGFLMWSPNSRVNSHLDRFNRARAAALGLPYRSLPGASPFERAKAWINFRRPRYTNWKAR